MLKYYYIIEGRMPTVPYLYDAIYKFNLPLLHSLYQNVIIMLTSIISQ